MGEEKPPPGIVLSSDPPQEEQQQPHQQQPISAPNSPSYFSHSVNPSPPFFTAVPGPTHSHGSGTEHDGGQRNSSAGVNNIYTNNNTFSIPSIIAMNGNSGSTPFQASGGLHNNSLSGAANPISTSMSMISPSRNFSNVMQHHKFRSPSLPVNSLGTPIEMPQLASISVAEAQSLLQKEPELTLFVDIRPFALYSKSRVQSAVNVCIPTTLLKRPTFVLARFAECMIPAQRDAIENLDRYESVVIYDQATEEVSPETYSPTPLIYTILKFSRSPSLKGKLHYLQGGFLSFEKEFADSVDQSAIRAERYNSSSISSSGSSSNIGSKPASKHGYSNSQPTNSTLMHTFNFPPVLTGFSLPTNSTKDGPMKPFASNIRSSLDGIDVDDEVAPVSIPKDLTPAEVKACFPLWLQDIINKDTGPRNIFRRFHDIEEAEKVRLQSAFSRGTSMLNTGNTTPTTTTGGNTSTGKQLEVAFSSSHVSLSPTTPGGGHIKYSFSAGVELGSKNRYNNIWPYDHTRVKVPELSASTTATGAAPTNGTASHDPRNTLTTYTTNTIIPNYDDTKTTNATNETQFNYSNYDKSLSGGGDYFNASYITTKGTKMRYIATQGPLPDTFTDFWHVVWAKRIPVIVMLTAEAEGGSVKCHRYWNNGVYGGIALRLVAADNVVLSERTGTCVTIRTFELAPVSTKGDAAMKVDEGSSNGARHTVVQVQYTAWPDLGSPANPEDLIALCMLKNKYLESWVQETPASADDGLLPWTIVHCSAGCGRTGTFCTVDSVISLLKDQAKNNPTETPFHNAAASTATATAPVTPTAGIEGRGENGEVAATAKGGGSTTTTIGHENVESHDLIYRTVHNFRRQRLSMVQVLRQYVLCYETVILWIHNQCGPTKHNQLLPQQQQLQGLLPQFQDEHSNKKKNK